MAYMHKETYEILQGSNIDNYLDDYFDIDDMIALPIQVLNQKGYKTEFCCAGHPFGEINEVFLHKDQENPEKAIHNTISVERRENPSYPDNDIRVMFWNEPDYSSYISFAEGISIPSLPPNFEADKDNPDIRHFEVDDNGDKQEILLNDRLTIRAHYNESKNTYEYLQDVLNTMRSLYEWAVSLPSIE